jgi:hypothetical protein
VAADVAERAELAVLVAEDEDGLGSGGRGEVVAPAREPADVADELPAAGEDPPLLELRDLRVAVVARLELAPALLRS